jgi:hypothetical protein
VSTVSIPCPHCAHVSLLQAARLPDKAVYFACPQCKGKVIADKKKILSPDPPARQAAPAPARPVADAPLAVASMAPPDRRFLQLPAGASFPSGIILGDDDAAVAEIQAVLRSHGSDLERVDSAAAARDVILNEQPALCLYVGASISGPPHAPMAPLTGLPPAFRRRLYLALIGDNLKTLDGSAAFLFQVNMTLARQDLPHLAAALFSGIEYHNRLYEPYFRSEEGHRAG